MQQVTYIVFIKTFLSTKIKEINSPDLINERSK